MSRQSRCVVMSLVCGVFLTTMTGCYAYKFKGQVGNPVRVSPTTPMKYRLSTVSFNNKGFGVYESKWSTGMGNISSSIFSVARVGGLFATKENLERVLVQQYPDLFTPSPSGIPLDIEFRIIESKESVGILGSFISGAWLIGLPSIWGMKDVCEVRVGIADNDDYQSAIGKVVFASRSQGSLTPFGFLITDPEKKYKGSVRRGRGFKVLWWHDNSEMKNAQHEVFTEEIAKAVAFAVTQYKAD